MTVFLLILKIIGITLLSILGLLLTIILLVLFVPVRYKIFAEKEGDSNDFLVEVKATWLLHFINILVKYSKELFYRVRITIFTIKSSVKKDKPEKKRRKTKEDKNDSAEYKLEGFDDNEILASEPVKEGAEEEPEDGPEMEPEIGSEKESEDEQTDETEENDSGSTESEDVERKSFFEKLKLIIKKAYNVLTNIPATIENIISRIMNIFNDIDYYIDAVNDEKNKQAFELCIKELKALLKNIKPKVFKGKLRIGLDDPYSNGKVASIFGVIFPFIGDDFELISDFDEKVIEGVVTIKGRITVFIALKVGIKLYFNKNVRRMIKIFKRED